MTEALFDAPAPTSAIKWADHEGRLVLVWPHVVKQFVFENGETGDVIEGRVIVLDAPGGTPVEYGNTVIFPKLLQGQVRGNIGKNRPNLGRVGKGQAKPGKTAPWILLDPNENDKQLAVKFLTNNVATRPAESTSDTQPNWNAGDPPF
jgi:hypothetical protein